MTGGGGAAAISLKIDHVERAATFSGERRVVGEGSSPMCVCAHFGDSNFRRVITFQTHSTYQMDFLADVYTHVESIFSLWCDLRTLRDLCCGM